MPDKGNNKVRLADFEKPPVVETVLGVEFTPLNGWDVRHFGLYWDSIRDRFPGAETRPAIARPSGDDRAPFDFVLERIGDPAAGIRCWFVNRDDTRLLQIQADRFIHNWRKVKGDEKYPHYDEAVRPGFAEELSGFLDFLDGAGIPRPHWRRCEVTYINHLEKGREWHTLDDLPRIFPAYRSAALSGDELSAPESVNLRWRHALPEGGGLTFALQTAKRSRDDQHLLQYQISAQVELTEEAEMAGILDALDRGRYAVVRSFETSTSPDMHALWGKKERVG